MKDLTYSQVKSFKEELIKFNNDLIKKEKLRKILVIMKNIKLKLSKMSNIYLMTLYMKILDVCLMKLMTSNEMKFYLMRLNLMNPNIMRLNSMRLDLIKLNLMRLIMLILDPIRLSLMRLDLVKLTILTLNPMRLNLMNLYLAAYIEYIELNKNKVQNVWIDEFKKWLKELRDAIDQKYMIKRELRMKIKELKSEKEDRVDLLEWKLRMEKISMKHGDVDEFSTYEIR